MRLKLTFTTQNSFKLPKSYSHILQAFVYSLFPEKLRKELHVEGFKSPTGRTYKLFVYSRLFGLKFNRKEETFASARGELSIYIASPKNEVMEKLIHHILSMESFTLNGNRLFLSSLERIPIPKFEKDKIYTIKMLSPITVHKTFLDPAINKKVEIYFHPWDAWFGKLVQENAKRKLSAFLQKEIQEANFTLKPFKIDPVKQYKIIVYKDGEKENIIKGWEGLYKIQGDPNILEFLYQSGLGARNSKGFGMWEIVSFTPSKANSHARPHNRRLRNA